MAAKYDSEYHPLLYAKSLARLPVGLAYGAVGVTTGAAIGVGGCALVISASSSSSDSRGAAEACGWALTAGAYIIQKSGNLVEYTLRPDMRRWKNLPEAFVISRTDGLDIKSCSHTSANDTVRTLYF